MKPLFQHYNYFSSGHFLLFFKFPQKQVEWGEEIKSNVYFISLISLIHTVGNMSRSRWWWAWFHFSKLSLVHTIFGDGVLTIVHLYLWFLLSINHLNIFLHTGLNTPWFLLTMVFAQLENLNSFSYAFNWNHIVPPLQLVFLIYILSKNKVIGKHDVKGTFCSLLDCSFCWSFTITSLFTVAKVIMWEYSV